MADARYDVTKDWRSITPEDELRIEFRALSEIRRFMWRAGSNGWMGTNKAQLRMARSLLAGRNRAGRGIWRQAREMVEEYNGKR